MALFPVDRDQDYMHEMWGTNKLVTDYSGTKEKRVLQEVMNDRAPKHDFERQNDIHKKIRNDEDYDDWNYGTEPVYGKTQ